MTNLSGANLNSSAAVGPQGEGMDSPSTFPAYPAYKDSGVEWLGEVPAHWVVKKLKREIVAQSGTDQKYDGGDFPLFGANGVIGETNTVSIQSACVLIGRVGSAGEINFINQVAGVSDNALIISNQVFNVPRYDFYLFHAIDIKSSVSKNAQPLITASSFRGRIVAVPMDVRERLNIARFLDHETARIDLLIEEQQRLIELLKEKRQAVISQAVTKGLDPTVSMKDSGVEWLGEVPAHWDVKALRRVIQNSLSNGIFKKKEDFGRGVLLVNVFDVYRQDFQVNYSTLDRVECTEVEASSFSVMPGDLFFVRSSLKYEGIAVVAVAGDCLEPVVYECHLIRARPDPDFLNGRYGSYLFNSNTYRSILTSKAKITTMTTIDQEAISSTLITVPPLSEQSSISTYLDRETGKIDRLISEADAVRQLLKERRSALISAAVTGKIDVRGWQPPASVPTHELVQEAV